MGENLAEARVTIDNINDMAFLFGNRDMNVKCIEEEFRVRIMTRGGEIAILGEKKTSNRFSSFSTKCLKCCREVTL